MDGWMDGWMDGGEPEMIDDFDPTRKRVDHELKMDYKPKSSI
jgi:hypothetical protein